MTRECRKIIDYNLLHSYTQKTILSLFIPVFKGGLSISSGKVLFKEI